jgi:hypothetical protein
VTNHGLDGTIEEVDRLAGAGQKIHTPDNFLGTFLTRVGYYLIELNYQMWCDD